MANFATHIGVGTVVAGTLATLTVAADVVSPENLVAVTLAGVLGSVLPDIDLKDSRPSKALFSGLAIFFAFAVLFTNASRYSIVELLMAFFGTLVFVRYGLHNLFHWHAVHRGIWHSILAGVFSALATAIIFSYMLGRPDGVAWLAAGFLLIGFLTHLILDEVYSVDVMDIRVKSSFGTALKFVDRRHPLHTSGMVLATLMAIFFAPPPKEFMDGLSSRPMWADLKQRLLPEDKWFGVIGSSGSLFAETDASNVPVATGSIPATNPVADVTIQPPK